MASVSRLVERVFFIARDAIADLLARTLLQPNALTSLGVVLNIIAFFTLWRGRMFESGILIAVAGSCDLLDGALARRAGRATPFGAFYDSVMDRVSDMAVYGGLLLWYYDTMDNMLMVVVTFLAMAGSIMVSYTRARAECLIPLCKVGFMERAERTLTLILGALFNRMPMALWIVAVGAWFTAIHRVVYTRKELKTHHA
ncbi:MAG: CDP-alcohol phosphatidyltransferase family protein [bacterium]